MQNGRGNDIQPSDSLPSELESDLRPNMDDHDAHSESHSMATNNDEDVVMEDQVNMEASGNSANSESNCLDSEAGPDIWCNWVEDGEDSDDNLLSDERLLDELVAATQEGLECNLFSICNEVLSEQDRDNVHVFNLLMIGKLS
ncbi:hypothetical protein BDN67DRAFT_984424 [Paxillus ammoniavirescens]|nr:hypothetical protein BDN67DRAFT_984424 [Paxillus ammoniavirescens]